MRRNDGYYTTAIAAAVHHTATIKHTTTIKACSVTTIVSNQIQLFSFTIGEIP